MSEKKNRQFLENLFKIGTPECAIFSALLAMVIALLFLLVGFWKTVLISLLMLAGAFIGGVRDKKQWFRDRINKLFPAPRPYREENDALTKVVRDAIRQQPAADDEEAPKE